MPGKGSVGKKNLARNGIRTVMFFSSLLPHCFNIRLARNFYQLMSSVIKLMTHFLLPHLWISVSIWVSVFGDGAKLVVDNQLFPLCLMSESCFISVICAAMFYKCVIFSFSVDEYPVNLYIQPSYTISDPVVSLLGKFLIYYLEV